METRLKETVHLFLFVLLCGPTIRFGSCAFAGSSGDADDTFAIRHNGTGKCLVAQDSGVALGPCNGSDALWKWGSGHRLFHPGSVRCLGLEVGTKVLALLPCNSIMLRWRCLGGAVLSAFQMGLAVSDELVSTKRDATDVWTRGGSQDNICQKPYRVVHTTDGNSAGAPCEFPFVHNGTWHHQCLQDDSSELTWCSTTTNFDTDGKMGYCLLPEEGCSTLFQGPEGEGGPCYQFVFQAAVTWWEALDSCRSQGADLFSLSSDEAPSFPIPDGGHNRMPERMWVGLHQLDPAEGWQWSDGAPLAYLRWEQEMLPSSALRESDCGVMNAKHNYETEACDMRLPYICKKVVNASQPEPTESVGDTLCEEGWTGLNGWCYHLVSDKLVDFPSAQGNCTNIGGDLASLHSLETLELIHTKFHSAGTLDVWIALMGLGDPGAVFRWLDQSPVNFTYWARGQPLQPSSTAGNCVFYSGPSHGWRVGDCDRMLPFLCQKRGNVTALAGQTGCSSAEGWRRHGDSCYRVDLTQVSFNDRCDITIRNRFEQAFVNRLLREHLHGDTQYFWTGLQDINTTGEYRWRAKYGTGNDVVYSNWGSFEPALAGGCAVMSTAKPVGRWEVKNCALFQAGSVCKNDLTAPSTPEPQPDPSLPCPKGWASRDGIPYCYKVFHGERVSRKRTWEEAERFCEALGAHLPSFLHPEEMSALHFVMRDSISDDRFFWVGLNRRNPADRSWEWSDGRPVSMGIMEQDFHEDDEYNRDCAGFKTMKGTARLFVFLLGSPPKPFYATPFHCDAKLEWVCQIPRGVTPKNPEWYNPDGHHDTSVFVDSREYWYVAEPRLTYQEASEYCSGNGNGSKLASPYSLTAVRQIIVNLPKTTDAKQSWWANVREHFIPMTYDKRWLHTIFLGTCTSITPQSLWPERDVSCETRLPFVCERRNVTSVERDTLGPHPSGQPCGENQASFRDKCYTVITPVEKTFKGANELCQSLRGTLLSISDQAEQDFVTTLLPSQPRKTWIGLKMSNSEPEWVDGIEVSFFNFNPLLHGLLRPMVINVLDPDSRELCVFVTNDPHSAMMGSWDFTTCSDQLNVTICQHNADKPEEPRVSLERFQVNNHTFMLIRQNVSWFGALEICRNHKMDLASVSHTLQQSALTVHVNRARTPMWLGLFSDDKGVHYRWTDHSHTVFSRWSPESTGGECVYLDTEGFWRGTECEDILEGAICHEPHEEMTPEDPRVAVKCPHKSGGPNWIPFSNNCYTFQLGSFRWDEFNKGNIHDTCRKLDASADVLTIRNAQENEFVRKELLPFSNLVQFVWLGVFKEEDNDDQMKWYDGTNVQYSNWGEGRPDVQGEFMAGVRADGLWDFYTNKRLFDLFKQRTIVACKLDRDSKDEYSQSIKAYERYGNLSYTVLTRKLSWFQALAECGLRGGHLASVHDIHHDAHVELIASKDGFPLWIGLSSQDAKGLIYEWSDGTRYDYKGLVSPPRGETAASAPRGWCVYVTTTGEWVRKDCNAMVDGAICYNTTVTTASQRANQLQAPQSTNHCPQSSGSSRWVQFQDQCYAFDMTFYNHSVYSMEDAKDICLGLDAQLLTIKTKEENDFVRDYVEENPLITSRVWLGMDLDTKGEPVGWVDGTAVGFSNFEQTQSKPGSAAGLSAPTPCVVLASADKGVWNLVSCKDNHSRIVCKVAARSGGAPVALGFFIIILLALLGTIAFVVYKKNRSRFSSTVRYKRNFDEADTTSIITDAE